MVTTPIVDLNGQWVEDAFQHIDNPKYRARLYPFLRKHRYHAILRIIMVTVEMKRSQAMTGENNSAKQPQARAKISAANAVRIISLKTRTKMSAAQMNRIHSEETKAKIRTTLTGKTHSKKAKANMSAAHIGKTQSEESRIKQSVTRTGKYTDKNNSNWQGGISFEPYCPRFNDQLKEQIRNRDNRICVLCGKSEIQNGKRLCVHHIDGDKMQGCNNKKWHLCALCISCNSKPDTIEKEFLIVSNLRFLET